MYKQNVNKLLIKTLLQFTELCSSVSVFVFKFSLGDAQCHYYTAITCSKSAIRTLGKDVRYI